MLETDQLSLNIPDTTKPRVVIIGGGFGGINVAKKLKCEDFQIVLFDRQNYHGFWPLLYQVATAGLEPDAIAEPLRKMFGSDDYEDFHFRLVKVIGIDPVMKTVSTLVGNLPYDYLVVATGSKSNYFGNDQVKKYSFPLKQIPDALNLRSQFLQCFEQASMTNDPEIKQSLMNFVIVGGGPTGVELAGALAEMRKHILPTDYPGMNFNNMNIYLVEGMDRVLPPMSPQASAKTQQYLEELGIDIRLNTLVESYDGNIATLKGGEQIRAHTLIWAAGVAGAMIDGLPEEAMERGRILVNQYNQVLGLNNIFAIGDIAFMKTDEYPRGHPGVAQPAIQQGKLLAKNLPKLKRGRPMEPFKYYDKGSLAIVGRNRAVADLPNDRHMSGFFAWVVWLFVHIMFLVGFRNKLVVLSNWIYRFFTYERGTRLIIRPFVRKGDRAKRKFINKYNAE
ncbi:NAD(P)/FAD-dependent oxidoreductase [Pontibacter diazotrophicus]|uniref:NADH:ubiquinone reductase (non-electrogenic) n=1 Tax=Pontibacter diazotrophicus TaxID=1400979 RepID=A0A3D8L789_9BACT|nr:NAD(P)/FAD-dependent oxidoreductase [Pontibacter diazotrophicus]RDV13275.1 NAD(P)/FAD-dependent oxidoreductase [Pontibacter diazotrophicus]